MLLNAYQIPNHVINLAVKPRWTCTSITRRRMAMKALQLISRFGYAKYTNKLAKIIIWQSSIQHRQSSEFVGSSSETSTIIDEKRLRHQSKLSLPLQNLSSLLTFLCTRIKKYRLPLITITFTCFSASISMYAKRTYY